MAALKRAFQTGKLVFAGRLQVLARVRRLEIQLLSRIDRDFVRNPRRRLQIVLSRMDRGPGLENSICRRILTASGSLIDVVRLDGSRSGLTDARPRSS